MSFSIIDKVKTLNIRRNLDLAKDQEANSLAKLSSGKVFTRQDPRPSDRAITDRMHSKIRILNVAKRNINDAYSLLNTANSALEVVSNTITRMKELNIMASSTTVSDQERRYIFIEFEALRDELNRIALTTEYNGIPLINGSSNKVPESLIFRIGDPVTGGDDVNAIQIDDVKTVDALPDKLGIQSSRELLADSDDVEGIALEDVEEFLVADDDAFPTAYDQALSVISTNRAIYGSIQNRLERAKDFVEVYQENIHAARSKIIDTDYAEETVNLLQARIGVRANTALLAQSNIDSEQALMLLRNIG